MTSGGSTDGNSRPIMFVARDVEVSPVVTTNRGEGTIRALKHYKDCPAEATPISQIRSWNSDCGTTTGLIVEQIIARALMNVARSVLIR